ncbi:MAG: AAA family ATPase [Patulibacter minatonensis]
MHVREITIKGFKSFPDRTRLEFGPGVSVIVGPNGSGKSNVTDAILWVLGEQSPAAIRGRSMQDVIFAGGHGVQARSSAEVELVLDNSDGAVPVPFTEISVARRINRDGEGEYRLNGAKCRLSDVMELLSDTGLGKEMHSVISQGRVEAIVTSKPRDRRLLLEEAAGLGKHRRRRRAAQRKLERAEGNLERVIDIEQQARKRLGPLRRQAEAAELRGRLDRQLAEARWELLGEEVRRRTAEEAAATEAVTQLRTARAAVDEQLKELGIKRGAAEAELQQRTTRRESLARRASQLRALAERQVERAERASSIGQETSERLLSRERSLQVLHEEVAQDQGDLPGQQRIVAIEAQLVELDERREEVLARELLALEETQTQAEAELERVRGRLADAQARQTEAEAAVDTAPPGAHRPAARGRCRQARIGTDRRRGGGGEPVPAVAFRRCSWWRACARRRPRRDPRSRGRGRGGARLGSTRRLGGRRRRGAVAALACGPRWRTHPARRRGCRGGRARRRTALRARRPRDRRRRPSAGLSRGEGPRAGRARRLARGGARPPHPRGRVPRRRDRRPREPRPVGARHRRLHRLRRAHRARAPQPR